MRVLVADGLASQGLEKLKSISGVELLFYSQIDREELLKFLPETEILIVRSRTQVDSNLLDSCPKLKLAIRAGIGLDNIDVAAATDKGIVVMNAPTGNIVTTAEHALAMLMSISRRIPQADASMKSGKWDKKGFQGSEIRGKTIGIVGLGNIGKALAERARGLSMNILAFDPYVNRDNMMKQGVHVVELSELLQKSDYVTIHVPLTSSTKYLIDDKAIALMKPGSYLINCARGGIVDESALYQALKSGHLAGAALDVFEVEPPAKDCPLFNLPNIILTPHLGASTEEAQVQVSIEVAEQVEAYVQNGALKNAVNVPNISIEDLKSMSPYLSLCERLGKFTAQCISHEQVKKLTVRYEGSLSTLKKDVLTLSVLKGFLEPILETPVNFVNAKKLMKERGIRVEESTEADCADYAGIVELKVEGKTNICVAGTLFGKTEARIVRIDDFVIDSVPEGNLLFTKNTDQPGVIGNLGNALSRHGVNIARMHLGRDAGKKEAIALINIDSKPTEETLKELKKIQGMLLVRTITI